MTYSRAALTLAAALFITAASHAGNALTPRKPLPKLATEELTLQPEHTGRIIIKFADHVRARATEDGGLRAATPVDAATAILAAYGMETRFAFGTHTEADIDAILELAARRSGNAQPDLAGMMHIVGPERNLEAAAQALNRLDIVEWVKFEAERLIGAPMVQMDRVRDQAVPKGIFDANQAPTAAALGLSNSVDTTRNPARLDGDGGQKPQESQGVVGCCLPTGTCMDMANVTDCLAQMGVPQSNMCTANSACGACCVSTGCFEPLNMASCLAFDPMAEFREATSCVNACPPGACCLPNNDCRLENTQALCEDLPPTGAGGFWQGHGIECDDAECDIECGQSNQNCFNPAGGGISPFCDNMDCCELVCELDPRCCEPVDEGGPGWDIFCAASANLLCTPHTPNWDPVTMMPLPGLPAGPDRCASFYAGSCFAEHSSGGCNQQTCCNLVCAVEPSCCDETIRRWDSFCVALARSFCGAPTAGVTPSFVALQGYLDRTGFSANLADPLTAAEQQVVPNVNIPGLGNFAIAGFNGEGFDLFRPGEPFTDGNGDQWYTGSPDTFQDFGRDGVMGTNDFGEGNGRWDPPGGLRGLAEQLLRQHDVDGLGLGNLASGRSVKVGVIEDGFWPGHEDLTHVRIERGQTIIEIPEIAENDHGTSVLSIITAADNGIGVTGMAPEAEAWFFPTTSVEEGPREPAAWFSAMGVLDEGDVICATYVPNRLNESNLNIEFQMFTLIGIATDLGITVCVEAGDSCQNLDDQADNGDSGVLVVSAGSPGASGVGFNEPYAGWYRLAESNYCTNPPADNSRGNMVHLRGWGSNVVAAGTGDLFIPPDGDPKRSYTLSFGGSSAACAQVAAACAGMQGLAKQFYGIPVTPEVLRFVMGAPGAPPENPLPLGGGFTGDSGCSVDFDPDLGPNWPGGYPYFLEFSVNELTSSEFISGFEDSPRLDDILVARGTNVRGSRFSVKGDDNKYLTFNALYTTPADRPLSTSGLGGGTSGGVPIPQVQDIRYIASGQIADLVFIGHSDLESVGTLIVENQIDYPNVFNVMVVELYDHRRQEFVFIDFIADPSEAAFVEANGDLTFAHVAPGASRFIQAGTDVIVGRIWTIGFPNISGNGSGFGDSNFSMRFDLVNLFLSENFGEPLPGG